MTLSLFVCIREIEVIYNFKVLLLGYSIKLLKKGSIHILTLVRWSVADANHYTLFFPPLSSPRYFPQECHSPPVVFLAR